MKGIPGYFQFEVFHHVIDSFDFVQGRTRSPILSSSPPRRGRKQSGVTLEEFSSSGMAFNNKFYPSPNTSRTYLDKGRIFVTNEFQNYPNQKFGLLDRSYSRVLCQGLFTEFPPSLSPAPVGPSCHTRSLFYKGHREILHYLAPKFFRKKIWPLSGPYFINVIQLYLATKQKPCVQPILWILPDLVCLRSHCLGILVWPQILFQNETSLKSGPYKVALIKQTACIQGRDVRHSWERIASEISRKRNDVRTVAYDN